MKIIDRYILKSHVGPFIFAFGTLLFVLILQFFTTFADRFIGKGIGFSTIAELILLQSAWMVGLAAPMATLVAVVMAFGSLTTTSEMTIFRASGISLYRLMIPVLCAAFLLSLLVERFNNVVLPQANYYAKSMMADIARSKPAFGLTKNAFSNLVDGYAIFVRNVDDRTKELQGIVIYDMTRPGYSTVATAEKGNVAFTDDDHSLVLTMLNGEIHQVSSSDHKSYRKINFGKHQLVFASTGFGFARSFSNRVRSDDSELSAVELLAIGNEFKRRILSAEKRIQGSEKTMQAPQQQVRAGEKGAPLIPYHLSNGAVATSVQGGHSLAEVDGDLKSIESNRVMLNKYMAAYHKKYALSLACFVFAMVGAPLGVLARRGGFGVGAAMSLVFFIFYWMLLMSGEKIAERGLLDPLLSLWIANIVMVAVGIVLVVSLSRSVFNTSR
ncbi:MAG: LptF/LptG family permease [Chlorobium sp.]